jgi:ribosomal protein S18 acetylase RimI-like enzyme
MEYELRETVPDPETFVALRKSVDMPPRSVETARQGLPNTMYGVSVVETASGETVAMARIVGDGATVYHICDMVVHPDHQRRGLGTRMMDALMAYVDEHVPETAYVNLMADVDGFYERWGFERTAPTSKAMALPYEGRGAGED